MFVRHWYNIFFNEQVHLGHISYHITPLGWITLAVVVAAVIIGVATQR